MNLSLHLFVSLLMWFQGEPTPTSSIAVESSGIAVVELFTSQGCSSCPPADAYLSQLVKEAQSDGKEIYPLSFHVDYWNYLGWKDPYSKERYSERQYAYAGALGERVYTPQMIINGKDVFVGSDKRKGNALIPLALGTPATHSIHLEILSSQKGTVDVQFSIKGDLDDTVLNLALVQDGLSDQISRGENRGRQLTHEHVVRAFRSLSVSAAKGTETVSIPKGASDLS
ncbi:MAG: DUF1223 domain-containing protein, partial [Bacteroidota bacterium]